MSSCQIKPYYLLQALIFLALLATASLSLAATESCTNIYISDSGNNINDRIQAQKYFGPSLLEATDIAYLYQGTTCLNLINKTRSEKSISIYLQNMRVRHVELIEVTGGTHNLIGIGGMEYPLTSWEKMGAEILFELRIPASTTKKLHLNIGSIFAYNSSFLIRDTEQIFSIITLQQAITGLLAGSILALVLYSLLVGIATKEKVYLQLFGSTVNVTLLQLNDIGMLYMIWPESLYWNNSSSGIFAVSSTLFGIALARNYLLTKEHAPRSDKWLRIVFWYTLLVAAPLPFLQNDTLFFALYALPTTIITLPTLVTISIIRIKQGYVPAKFYLLALCAPIVAGVIIFLMYAGVLPSSQITRALPLIGTAVQLILFGLAIGKRIHWMNTEKDHSTHIILQARAESEAKKNFLTHVSHELRTPLAGIIGLSEIARKNPIYKDNKQLVEGIIESAETLLASVNMLLDYARVNSGKWKTNNTVFNVNLLVEEVINNHGKQLRKKGISINYQIDQSTPSMIEGERNITQKILDCVIEYSITNMSNGHILFKVEPEKFNDQYAIRFDIIDTGDGIAEDHKPEIFEIFEQPDRSTTRTQRGMGISLSLSKKLCTLLGGDINFESNALHGTAFWCHIPCRPVAETSTPVVANQPKNTASAPNSSLLSCILVAEDDETLQLVVASQLEKLGKTFRLYPNGKPLVEDYIKNHTDISAILLDWNMPICNAGTATLLIRDYEKKMQIPPISIVIMTAHDKASTSELNLPHGIHVLHKPVTTSDLEQLFISLQKP